MKERDLLACFNSNYGWICIESAPDCELFKIYTSFSLTLAKVVSGWSLMFRCSLITVITLTDHLHMTHFRAANVMATAVRKTLSPNHPLRRLLSVFTFGSIFVNLQAGIFQKSVITCNYVSKILDHPSNSVMHYFWTVVFEHSFNKCIML